MYALTDVVYVYCTRLISLLCISESDNVKLPCAHLAGFELFAFHY